MLKRAPFALLAACLALTGCPEDPSPADDAAIADMLTADQSPPPPPADMGEPEPPPPADMGEPEPPPADMGEPEPPPPVDMGEPEPPPPVDMGEPEPPPPADMGEPEPPPPVDMGEPEPPPTVDMGEPEPPPPDMGAEPEPFPDPLSPRPDEQGCQLPEAPALGDYGSERAFPNLSFNRPLWFGTAPGDPDTIFVMEQGGTIYAFDDDQAVARNARSVFLDVDASRAGNEEGLLGLAFHPSYAENGRFYIYYSGSGDQCGGGGRCSIVSEFRRAERRQADPASERIVMRFSQPFSNHNGGDMHFGPDGYLYIAVGDGGSGGDPLNSGQTPSTVLGSILRIDVDGEPPPQMGGGEGDGEEICENTCRFARDNECDDGGPGSMFDVCAFGSDCADCGPRVGGGDNGEIHAYRVPPDNPFADGEDGHPSVWAWGLRNVWRMAFDPSTGVLWAGDVGQNAYEEIDRITGPGNFGWKLLEGNVCYRGNNCPCPGCLAPIHVYPHAQGRSVTGGHVYRGQRLPALWGRYLFADFVSGRVWALQEREGQDPAVTQLTTVTQPSSFGVDAQGRTYITSFNGQILRLRRLQAAPGEPFPRLLSETGCYDDVAENDFVDSVIPYELVQPFWSDNALKLRHIALPADAVIGFALAGPFEFPVGTVFVKTFLLPDEAGMMRRIETRMYARQQQGWRGFSWRWNAEQDDAVLVEGALDEELMGPDGVQTWHYPSNAECDQCHTEAGGRSLGWRAQQLNRSVDYPRGTANQLRALEAAGYLELPAPAEALPAWAAIADNAAPVAERARAYLDINCAMCHQPTGPGNAAIDLRYETPFAETGMCDGAPAQDLGVADARIIAPGAPDRSVLLRRMNVRGEHQMPPLGSNVVDGPGVALIRAWIEQLDGCP